MMSPSVVCQVRIIQGQLLINRLEWTSVGHLLSSVLWSVNSTIICKPLEDLIAIQENALFCGLYLLLGDDVIKIAPHREFRCLSNAMMLSSPYCRPEIDARSVVTRRRFYVLWKSCFRVLLDDDVSDVDIAMAMHRLPHAVFHSGCSSIYLLRSEGGRELTRLPWQ
jgi:hypothetical protein